MRAHEPGPAAVSVTNLSALTVLDRARLQQLWRALCERPAPPRASRSLLIYGLAYRIQQSAYGALGAKPQAAAQHRTATRVQGLAARRPGAGHALDPTVARAAP